MKNITITHNIFYLGVKNAPSYYQQCHTERLKAENTHTQILSRIIQLIPNSAVFKCHENFYQQRDGCAMEFFNFKYYSTFS